MDEKTGASHRPMSSQRSSSMEASQHNIRKRVCKACDRCRLKKSKCDGSIPCSRCKADSAICVFGERKRVQDKVYPKGYVEMLERQQTQLVSGLREIYRRLHSGQGWPGQPLCEGQGGHPLTHDIIERLDLLHPTSEGSTNYEGFKKDCINLQQKLIEESTSYTHIRRSISSDSEHGPTSPPPSNSDTPTMRSIPFSNSFARNNDLPTPYIDITFPRQPQIVQSQHQQIKQEASTISLAFMNAGALNPSVLSRSVWSSETMMPGEPPEFIKSACNFDSYNGLDQKAMGLKSMVKDDFADPMMPEWNSTNELDFSTFINSLVGA